MMDAKHRLGQMLEVTTEAQIQRAIVDLLTLHGWLVIPFAAPGTHKALRGVVMAGWPDLLAIKDGRYVHIEVKAKAGVLRKSQKLMHTLLRGQGCTVITARSRADVEELIAE